MDLERELSFYDTFSFIPNIKEMLEGFKSALVDWICILVGSYVIYGMRGMLRIIIIR